MSDVPVEVPEVNDQDIADRVRRLVAARDGCGDPEATEMFDNVRVEYWNIYDLLAWLISA